MSGCVRVEDPAEDSLAWAAGEVGQEEAGC